MEQHHVRKRKESLLNVECDNGQRYQQEGDKDPCLLGSVTQVSRTAPHTVGINIVADVALHALFGDQVVKGCNRQRECTFTKQDKT